MAFDAYVKIEGIPGEALDDKYKDCIEITGYGIWDALKHFSYYQFCWRRTFRADFTKRFYIYKIFR